MHIFIRNIKAFELLLSSLQTVVSNFNKRINANSLLHPITVHKVFKYF